MIALNIRRQCLLLTFIVLAGASQVQAQYTFNPSAEHEQGPGIRYFGSAKDSTGDLMSEVTVLLAVGTSTFVFFTDEQGRFRGKLPVDATREKVTARCSKPGYTYISSTKRPGVDAGVQSVQVDCVLRVATAK